MARNATLLFAIFSCLVGIGLVTNFQTSALEPIAQDASNQKDKKADAKGQHASLAAGYVANHPVAWWRIDEPAGTKTAHDVLRVQHGTYNMPNGDFDGKHGYIDVGNVNLKSKALTILARFNAKSFPRDDVRVISMAKGENSEDHYFMLSTADSDDKIRLRFRLKTNNKTTELVAESGDIRPGQDVFAACVYDGKTMRIYQDGKLVGETKKRGKLSSNDHVHTWIGDNPSGVGSRAFHGKIKDVALFDHALGAQQVAAIFAAGNDAALVADGDKKAKNDRRNAELKTLKQQVTKLEKDLKSSRKKLAEQAKKSSEMTDKQKGERARKRIEELANQQKALTEKLEAQQKSMLAEKQNAEKSRKAADDAMQRIKQLEKQNKKLTEAVPLNMKAADGRPAEGDADDKAALAKKVAELEKKLAERQQELAQANADAAEKRKALEAATQMLKKKHDAKPAKDRDNMRTKLADLQKKLDQQAKKSAEAMKLSQDKLASQKKLAIQNKELKSRLAAAEKKWLDSDKRAAEFKKELEQATGMFKEAQEKSNEMAKELMAAERLAKELAKKTADDEKKLTAAAKANERMVGAESKLKIARKRIATSKAELAETQKKLSDLRDQLKMSKAAHGSSEEGKSKLASELEKNQQNLDQLQERIRTLETEQAKLKQVISNTVPFDPEAPAFRSNVDSSDGTVDITEEDRQLFGEDEDMVHLLYVGPNTDTSVITEEMLMQDRYSNSGPALPTIETIIYESSAAPTIRAPTISDAQYAPVPHAPIPAPCPSGTLPYQQPWYPPSPSSELQPAQPTAPPVW